MKDTLEKLLDKAKGEHICKSYKLYKQEVQEMMENLYKATYRLGLYDSQILYVLDEALKPFKKGKN